MKSGVNELKKLTWPEFSKNLNLGIKGDSVSKKSIVCVSFSQKWSLKVSQFLHDAGRQYSASFDYVGIYGEKS